MDEKIKDQETLLVKDSKDENLKALSGTDEKGGLKTVSPTAEHEQSFLNPSLTGKIIFHKFSGCFV